MSACTVESRFIGQHGGKGPDAKYKTGTHNPAEPPAEQIILATASYDHDIKLWEAPTGQCLRTLKHDDSVSFYILMHKTKEKIST